MKSPLPPNLATPPPATQTATAAAGKKPRPRRPEEVLAYYESQGLDSRAAALKAITDLQILVQKSIAVSGQKGRVSSDNINTRLAILEAKIDSKPGVPECLAIGVVSGAVIRGFGAVLPHVVGGMANIWGSVRAATTSSSHSS